jgi:DNA-directed RNA polymerase subunit RPC12/RpoP
MGGTMSDWEIRCNQQALRDLDRYLTTPPEPKEPEMMPANTEVTCPACETDFTTTKDIQEEDILYCENCSAKLILLDADIQCYEDAEDIMEEEELSDIEDIEDIEDDGTKGY